MATDPADALRDIALALPEVVESESEGQSSYRVRNRIFLSCHRAEDGSLAATLKCLPGDRAQLLDRGAPWSSPPYLGDRGWIGVALGPDTDWRELGELVVDSYRQVAPDELSAGIGVAAAGPSLASRAVLAVGNVIGELIEGKPPKDQVVAETQVDDDLDDGLVFDPDDPRSTTIDL